MIVSSPMNSRLVGPRAVTTSASAAADDRHLRDPGQPRAGVEIEPEAGDLILVRGVAPAVVRGVAVDDEEAAETPRPRPMLEERPAHPGPVAILVEARQRNVPRSGEKRLEVEARVDAGMDEEDVAGAPVRAQRRQARRARAPAATRAPPPATPRDPRAARRPRRIRRASGRRRWRSRLRAPRSRRSHGVAEIEREPHHRLVVAHERDPFVGADALRGADREIDRAEAVGPAIDEVAEKDDRALLAPPRLARGFVEERVRGGRRARECRRRRKSPCPGWRPNGSANSRRSTTAAMRRDLARTGVAVEHCTAAPAHARIASCFSSSSPICGRRMCR